MLSNPEHIFTEVLPFYGTGAWGNLGNGFPLAEGKEFSGPPVAAAERDFRSQRLILPWLWKRDL